MINFFKTNNAVKITTPTHVIYVIQPTRVKTLHVMVTDLDGNAASIELDTLLFFVEEAQKRLMFQPT